jgi:hypothetical protein
VERAAGAAREPILAAIGQHAILATRNAVQWARETVATNRVALEAGARCFAYTVGRSLALAFAIEHAEACLVGDGNRRPLEAARRFAAHGIDALSGFRADPSAARVLALGEG